MSGGVEDGEAQLADNYRFTVIDADIDKGGGAVTVHDHRDGEPFAQFMAGGEMIGVGVRVQQI